VPIIDLNEAFGGLGEVQGVWASQAFMSGAFGGVGGMAPATPLAAFLVGGWASGQGTIQADTEASLTGILPGLGTVSGSPVLTKVAAGWVRGMGDILDSAPYPMAGYGDLVGCLEVRQQPTPICRTPEPTAVRWGRDFGRCDLTLCLRDSRGMPYSPVGVSYTMYQVMDGGYKLQRGPAGRTPVMEGVGSYYVTGTIGECGQPGDWVIVWKWQKDAASPVQCATVPFRVVDSANCFCDTTTRVKKYGWEC
jgi:hypothetical protein